MASFDFTKPILILAPHLVMPPRNGADILVERSARWLSHTSPEVTVLGAAETITFRNGIADDSPASGSGMRSRSTAAARTIAMRSHYYRERFLTASFRQRATQAVVSTDWGGIICSYLTTVELAEGVDVAVAAWTHNDEFQWFDDLTNASVNPVARQVASQSLAYLRHHGNDLAHRAVLMHVTEADAAGFRSNIGDHTSIIVPIGTDIDVPTAKALPPGEHTPHLLFVGSLSVQMNADALRHFGTEFYPSIDSSLPEASVTVAGSNPTRDIRALCDDHGWELVADPSDTVLDNLYLQATFSILPFPYATGAKLKLLASLAHGVPYLASGSVDVDPSAAIAPSMTSDSPDDWATEIQAVLNRGITALERKQLVAAANANAWEKMVAGMLTSLAE